METAQSLSKDLSASCPLDFKEKVNSGALKCEDGTFKDADNSFLLTLLNMLVCSNSQPFNTILDQNGGNNDADGASDHIASLIDSIGDEALSKENISGICKSDGTAGKHIDTANLMNMIFLATDGQLITSDTINDCSLTAPVISSVDNANGTLMNLNNTDGDKSDKTTNAINNILNIESVKNVLLGLIDEAGESNETDADCDLTCNIAGKKEAGDSVKMVIDSSKYPSAIKIDKAIGDKYEKPIQDSVIRSTDGEEHLVNEVDGKSDTSGDAGVQNENRDNVKLVIDGSKYQFGSKDQKTLSEHGKNPSTIVVARSVEELCDDENNKNKVVEGDKAKNGHVNDLEKFGLGVGKTSVTVNSQESSIGSSKEIISPKNQQEVLSGKIGGNFTKSEGEKFGDDSDKGDAPNNNHEQKEKTLKGHEIIEPIKNNKALGQATNESTFAIMSSKKVSFDANIHHDNDLEIEADNNSESQISASQKNDIKNSELSTQTKTIPANDKQLQSSILSQVIDKASVSLKNGLSSIVIKLRPETLGNLKMHISTENNQVSIKIVTEGQLVKEIVENNIMQLKSDLQSQGMEITKVEVVADQNQGHNKSNQGHSRFTALANKKDNENQPDIQEQWNVNHEDGINEGRVSFFA